MRSMLHISGGKRLPERDYGHIEKVNPAGAGLTLVRCVALRWPATCLCALAPTARAYRSLFPSRGQPGFPLWVPALAIEGYKQASNCAYNLAPAVCQQVKKPAGAGRGTRPEKPKGSRA